MRVPIAAVVCPGWWLLASCSAVDPIAVLRDGLRGDRAQVVLSRAESVLPAPPVEPRLEPAAPQGPSRPGAGQTTGAALPVADAPDPVLVAVAAQVTVYRSPSAKARIIGYLRRGAVVSRSPEPAGNDGCAGGFYAISPDGFVCSGPAASTDPDHPLSRVASRRAERDAVLPYVYARARVPSVPVYARVPAAEEIARVEPTYSRSAAREAARAFDGNPFDPTPPFLSGFGPSLRSLGVRRTQAEALVKSAVARSGFALVTLFDTGERQYGLTADLTVVPLDAIAPIEPSRFHGLVLAPDQKLPVAFQRSRSAALYSGDPRTTGLRFERRLEFREAFVLSGETARVGKVSYVQTASGEWMTDRDLLRVEPDREMPPWAASGARWIDVSIEHQTLIAYEGTRPVFVTLVSTGSDGAKDPATTRSTVRGEFRIHTKHVTATMDSDEIGDEYELRDVPYVQYFKEGYAFHAVYWHDGFGAPRSHGCVNLSPRDARWLFSFTDPKVPTSWHSALESRGTRVVIHE